MYFNTSTGGTCCDLVDIQTSMCATEVFKYFLVSQHISIKLVSLLKALWCIGMWNRFSQPVAMSQQSKVL